jgi:hypothetical protein
MCVSCGALFGEHASPRRRFGRSARGEADLAKPGSRRPADIYAGTTVASIPREVVSRSRRPPGLRRGGVSRRRRLWGKGNGAGSARTISSRRSRGRNLQTATAGSCFRASSAELLRETDAHISRPLEQDGAEGNETRPRYERGGTERGPDISQSERYSTSCVDPMAPNP